MSDYEAHPTVMWELTRACDLHCRNCTIRATGARAANELTTYEAYKTIDEIANVEPRELVITGGDPLEREDVYQIINYARRRGLDPALVVSPTSRLSFDAIDRLVRNGLTRIVFGIDGATPQTHDGARGPVNTLTTTRELASAARGAGLAIEVNTLVNRRTAGELEAIADLIRPLRVARWNLYFEVPLTTPTTELMTAAQTESVFATIDAMSARETFPIRTVEAPQYRRYLLQRGLDAALAETGSETWSDFRGYDSGSGFELGSVATQDALDDVARDGARSFIFISHAGDVRASEFLPFSAGNLRYRPLSVIYRGSDLFVALRDPANLTGKCGRCEFRRVCGGSRARAWAVEGHVFADDPLCAYMPGIPMPLPVAHIAEKEV